MHRIILGGIFCMCILLSSVMAETGAERYAMGDYTGAITYFEQELNATEGSLQSPILNNIGTCYVALDQPEKAIEYYQKAVTVDPGYARGWINLGVVQEKLGNADEALASYEKVTDADPGVVAEAYVKKGTLLASQQRLEEALAAFRSAESGAKGLVLVDMYTGIGGVEFMLKNTDAAEQAFLKTTEADPGGAAMAWTNLGVLRISQGRYADAKAAFETAIRNDPTGKTKAAAYLQKLQTMGG